jgi:hypothetical protein
LELTKLAKNGLLNINIYSNCVVAHHVAHSRFYVSNSRKEKKSRTVRSGERCGQGQSSLLLITQPGNCFRMHWWYTVRTSFILLPPHLILLDIVNTNVSLYNVVTYISTLSCRDFFQQSVNPEQLTSSNQLTIIETIIARKW